MHLTFSSCPQLHNGGKRFLAAFKFYLIPIIILLSKQDKTKFWIFSNSGCAARDIILLRCPVWDGQNSACAAFGWMLATKIKKAVFGDFKTDFFCAIQYIPKAQAVQKLLSTILLDIRKPRPMTKTALQNIRGRIEPQRDFTSCSRLFCCACPQDSTTFSSSFLSSLSSSSSSSCRLLLFLDSSCSAANAASVSCSWLASAWEEDARANIQQGVKPKPLL